MFFCGRWLSRLRGGSWRRLVRGPCVGAWMPLCALDNFNQSNTNVSNHQFVEYTETILCQHSVSQLILFGWNCFVSSWVFLCCHGVFLCGLVWGVLFWLGRLLFGWEHVNSRYHMKCRLDWGCWYPVLFCQYLVNTQATISLFSITTLPQENQKRGQLPPTSLLLP